VKQIPFTVVFEVNGLNGMSRAAPRLVSAISERRLTCKIIDLFAMEHRVSRKMVHRLHNHRLRHPMSRP
jgi:hypothetical protein